LPHALLGRVGGVEQVERDAGRGAGGRGAEQGGAIFSHGSGRGAAGVWGRETSRARRRRAPPGRKTRSGRRRPCGTRGTAGRCPTSCVSPSAARSILARPSAVSGRVASSA